MQLSPVRGKRRAPERALARGSGAPATTVGVGPFRVALRRGRHGRLAGGRGGPGDEVAAAGGRSAGR
eukprot:1191707-Lingulodinium_polyedra.AAC.1